MDVGTVFGDMAFWLAFKALDFATISERDFSREWTVFNIVTFFSTIKAQVSQLSLGIACMSVISFSISSSWVYFLTPLDIALTTDCTLLTNEYCIHSN